MNLPWRVLSIAVVLLAAATAGRAAGEGLTGDRIPTGQGDLVVHPVQHATLVLQWGGKTIYVDPVGGAAAFRGLPRPDFVLVTDIHGDHLDVETLKAVVPAQGAVRLIVPKAVAEKLPEGPLGRMATVLAAGEKTEADGIAVEAVPAYNTTPERKAFHVKGRGVGYLVRLGGKTVYVAGDTEDIPEMRKLQKVDVAFLPMNLPYTMSVEQAAGAVREFKPKIVYPYHFRNRDGSKSDLEAFKKLVGDQSAVEVRIREWYPR